MRVAHGCVPRRALCGVAFDCYGGVMKPQPHPNFGGSYGAERSPNGNLLSAEAELRTDRARKAAPLSVQRYPSLSDDHMPPMFSARLIAALAIIAIFVALIAAA